MSKKDRLGRNILFYAVFGDQPDSVVKIFNFVKQNAPSSLRQFVTHRDAFGNSSVVYAALRRRSRVLGVLSDLFPDIVVDACSNPLIRASVFGCASSAILTKLFGAEN